VRKCNITKEKSVNVESLSRGLVQAKAQCASELFVQEFGKIYRGSGDAIFENVDSVPYRK
jgi:hypothetical protein